jgi:hypothetical protein
MVPRSIPFATTAYKILRLLELPYMYLCEDPSDGPSPRIPML